MKTILSTVVMLFAVTAFSQSQTMEVEKSLYGVQAGFLGAEIYNETKLSPRWALRSQVAFLGGILGGTYYEKTLFTLVPSLGVAPKYYYNIASRGGEKGKNITNNGANFFSFQVNYIPKDVYITNYEGGLSVPPQMNIIPTYGIRRNFAKNFNFEFKIGLGVGFSFYENGTERGAVLDLGFKIGYDFYKR